MVAPVPLDASMKYPPTNVHGSSWGPAASRTPRSQSWRDRSMRYAASMMSMGPAWLMGAAPDSKPSP